MTAVVNKEDTALAVSLVSIAGNFEAGCQLFSSPEPKAHR